MPESNTYSRIAPLIINQFPEVYRVYGQDFIDFVTAYYEWLESSDELADIYRAESPSVEIGDGGPLYHARRLLEYQDIDLTEDDFISHFKSKYLNNIQFQTATNTQQLVKHSLDLYRSRGTPRAVRLFFQLVYGEESSVYTPGQDVFRTSDAKWYIPTYLEVIPSDSNKLFIDKEIVGLQSGAKAFVDSVVTKRYLGRYSDIFYISGLTGDFITGESIILATPNNSIIINENPIVRGSLTNLTVTEGGGNFSIGEVVDVVSINAKQGKARVTALSTVTGAVNFNLVDGGWGYTTLANSTISTQVYLLSNVQIAPSNSTTLQYSLNTTFKQPLANIAYSNSVNSSLSHVVVTVGDTITAYSGVSVAGTGRVLSVQPSGNSGYILATTLSGSLSGNSTLVDTTNSITISVSSFNDISAYGNLIGYSSNSQIYFYNNSTDFVPGTQIYQHNSLGQETANGYITNYDRTGQNITVANISGVFISGVGFSTRDGSVTAYVNSITLTAGFTSLNSTANFTFSNIPGNFVYDTTYGSNASVTMIYSGSGASYNIASLTFTDSISVAPPIVYVKGVALNATSYGANLNNTAHGNSLYSAFYPLTTLTVGSIGSLNGINPGVNYNYPPFAVPSDFFSRYGKHDFIFTIANTNGNYITGELITQPGTGANSIVVFANSTLIKARRITFTDRFVPGGNSIIGQSSGANSTLVALNYDTTVPVSGLNANIQTSVNVSNNSVAALSVIDSGFGYSNGDVVQFISQDGMRAGAAIVGLGKQGTGSGSYQTESGFLSSNKYLHDGSYYQDFSYEVRSPIPPDGYADMLEKILHVAGTKHFSALVKSSVLEKPLTMVAAQITTSNSSAANSTISI